MRFRTRWPLALAGALAVLAAAASAAEAPDWSSVADLDTVSVATNNPDGTLRYTTVWIVVVGGRGYIRTGDTTWGANVTRNPNLKLVVGDQEYALRADFVEAEDERALVLAAFNEKYGVSDTLVGWFFHRTPKIMRLASL
jgi:opacity protein-like surface antigen